MAIKDSGERSEFASGAVRDMHSGKGRLDLLPWYAIHEVAKHCEEGALKYGERNVDKGIPAHSFLDSAIRHLIKYLHNEQDEPHLRAAAWNILWLLEQETTHPELNDLPFRKTEFESFADLGNVATNCKHVINPAETTDGDDALIDEQLRRMMHEKCMGMQCGECTLFSHVINVKHENPDLYHKCFEGVSGYHLQEHYRMMFPERFKDEESNIGKEKEKG